MSSPIKSTTIVQTPHGSVSVCVMEDDSVQIDVPGQLHRARSLHKIDLHFPEHGEPGVYGPGLTLNACDMVERENREAKENLKHGPIWIGL